MTPTDKMIQAPRDRTIFLSARLRRHFGEVYRGEPTMTFFADGSVDLSAGGLMVHLTKEQADSFDV